MIALHIDGHPVAAEAGMTVLAAARQAGIFIPSLCDHPALRPAGGCRLCLVEVQGARAPQSACTLPVSPGLVITTDTPALRASRQMMLSLLFREGNHLCPFCPVSGGDCELQNSAYHENMTHWPQLPAWQAQAVDASAEHLVFDPNRCILCRRCVRACEALVGNRTLGVAARGAETRIVADADVPWGQSSCVQCGTCVQICPTGALVNRREVYQGLTADTTITNSICLGCSVGCGIKTHTRAGRLVRVEGDWASPVSEGLLCRAGRYQPVEETRERVLTPLVRHAGALVPAGWDEALEAAATGLRGASGLISPRLPVEALAAFRQLMATGLTIGLLTRSGESGLMLAPALNGFEADLTHLRTADVVILLDVNVERSHQVAGFFIKRRLPRELKLVTIGNTHSSVDEHAAQVLRPMPGQICALLQAWLQALEPEATEAGLAEAAAAAGVTTEDVLALAHLTRTARQPVLVYGTDDSTCRPAVSALLLSLANAAGHLRLLGLCGAANCRAALRLGLTSDFAPEAHTPVFVDLGDDDPAVELLAAVHEVPFLVAAASYHSSLTERADVVLPVETWAELSGHYLNLEGRWQVAHAALEAPAGVWSNLAVLEGLAERAGVTLEQDWSKLLEAHRLVAASLN